jgi:hypothetical protein
MKNRWILIIYPALALVLLLAAYGLFKDWFALSWAGERQDAVIAALFLDKGDGSGELLTHLEYEITLLRQDGSEMRVIADNYDIQSITDRGRTLDLSEGVAAALGGDQALATDLEELIEDAADRTQWFMLRQSRLDTPERFVRVAKQETAFVYRGLDASQSQFKQAERGDIVPVGAEDAERVDVVTTALYSYEDPDALAERKGDHLIEYVRTMNGEAVDPGKSQFFVHNQPYATINYPIFAFDFEGQAYAVLSDLGKHGDPFLAFPYRAEVISLFMPEDPYLAVMVGKITPPQPGEPYLNWFSRVSEIYMTRWVYPIMFGIMAFICAVVGLIFISMVTHPAKRLPPIPEEKKKEKKK